MLRNYRFWPFPPYIANTKIEWSKSRPFMETAIVLRKSYQKNVYLSYSQNHKMFLYKSSYTKIEYCVNGVWSPESQNKTWDLVSEAYSFYSWSHSYGLFVMGFNYQVGWVGFNISAPRGHLLTVSILRHFHNFKNL